MKVITVIQARMGSTRLRGKTLSPIFGIPLLKRVYDNIYKFGISDEIIIATSSLVEDDPIESYCEKFLLAKCFRGDAHNVLSRFIEIADVYDNEDTIVRVTADNLFYQESICKSLLSIHLEGNYDYTGIKGLSHIVFELIKVRAFSNINFNELTDFDKEHVTPYFIKNFKSNNIELVDGYVFNLEKEKDCLLTLDTEKDRERIEKIIKDFNNLSFTRENLYDWIKDND